jgi:hypothetical protein
MNLTLNIHTIPNFAGKANARTNVAAASGPNNPVLALLPGLEIGAQHPAFHLHSGPSTVIFSGFL